MRSHFKQIISIFMVFVMIACAVMLASCSSTVVDENRIMGIEISNEKGDVKVEAALTEVYVDSTSAEKLYLLAFNDGYAGTIRDYTVVGESKVKKNMSFKFNIDGENAALISAPFVIAELVSGEKDTGVYKAITAPAYISNPEKIAEDASGANGGGFKGLATFDINDANYLGAGSVLFEVDMGEMMLPQYNENAINFYYEGNSYYFDKAVTERLDKLTEDADRLGMKIYLRTSLKYPTKDEDGIYAREPFEKLYADCSVKGKNGYLPALDSEGIGYVKAFYAFLSSRYGKHGALDYIIGESVNLYSENCFAGEKEAEKFVAEYYSWARCAHNVLRSYQKNARVYLSVDNALRNDGVGGAIGTKLFLLSFVAYSPDSADWNYGIALDLGNGEDISDVISGKVDHYSYIGVNNLTDLTELLDKPEHQYAAERRPIIIDSLSLPETVSEKNRAAYYSYAYYKAKEAGYSCFIYSADGESSLYSADGARSDLYYAFLMCGSNYTGQLKDYASKITGGANINFSSYISRKLTYEQKATNAIGESVKKKTTDLPVGFGDFSPSGSCINLDVKTAKSKDGKKVEKLLLSGNVTDMYAAMTADVTARDVMESGYVGITMSSPEKPSVALIIHDSATGASYVGEAQITEAPATYYFNISSFTENIESSDSLQFSLCILKSNSENVSLTVEDIQLYGSSGNGTNTTVIIIIVAVIILALCGLIVLLVVTRKKKAHGA